MSMKKMQKELEQFKVKPVLFEQEVYFVNSNGVEVKNKKLADLKDMILRLYKTEIAGNPGKGGIEYFSDVFNGVSLFNTYPFDLPAKNDKAYEKDSLEFEIPQQWNIDNLTTVISALSILLTRYTGNADFVIECDRLRLTEDKTSILCDHVFMKAFQKENIIIEEFHSAVKDSFSRGYDMSGISLHLKKKQMKPNQLNAGVMFLDSIDEYINFSVADFIWTLSENNNPIVLVFCRTADKITAKVVFNRLLLELETIKRFTRHYINILDFVCNRRKKSVNDIDFLTKEEKNSLLIEYNNTEETFELKPIVDHFKEQVHLNPEKVAYIFRDKKISFKEIDRLSSIVAVKLQKNEVHTNIPVGVYLERSPETAIAILGILKAGGVYVPLDLSYPSDYIEYIVNESKLNVIITDSGLAADLADDNKMLLLIDDLESNEDVEYIKSSTSIQDLSLIMYTSGSTGMPKGVAMEQQQLLNRFNWLWSHYPFAENDIASQRTNVNFIPSLLEIFCGLLKGVTTVILPDEIVKDPERLIDELENHRVSRVAVVPSLLKVMLNLEKNLSSRLNNLRLWFTAGEPLLPDLYTEFCKKMKDKILVNDYGSTEVNGIMYFDSRWEVSNLSRIPVGRPISNTKVYILDEKKRLVPQGIPGELHIGGAPVSRGYINRKDLTDEKFIVNPFSDDATERIYCMGDVVRYRADGYIEVIGRKDFQVKINGKRVEVGGVEKVLCEFEKVKEAAVIVKRKSTGNKSLVGFYVPSGELIENDLRDYLEANLPDYMIPSILISIEKLPKTPNGKLDRMKLKKSLSEKKEEQQIVKNEIVSRKTFDSEAIVKELISICAKISERPQDSIDIKKDFVRIGIDSLEAVRLIKKVNKTFSVMLSVTSLFDHVCIESLGAHIFNIKEHEEDNYIKKTTLSLNSYNEQSSGFIDNEVAIIGMSGRFPGANNPDEFWENLKKGKSHITEVPESRWSIDKYYSPTPQRGNTTISKWGGFMSGVGQFEPLFFNISPKEAELMDPQQRLCLQESWKALEDAGYAVESLSGKSVGVFLGSRGSDYFSNIRSERINTDSYKLTGNDAAILSGRVSYNMNIVGPCISVDTACSSSLAALTLAYKSVQAGDSEMAITGGVCVLATQQLYVLSSQVGMLSPTGQCYTFDNRADGFVPGEGIGIVVLKSLKKALKDGDQIYAVIKGAEINQDGHTNGITAPSKDSQKNIETLVYNKYKINPETIGYVEAHGTGTKLGDPIEIEALTESFREFTDKKEFCAIGSVKTNIGHTNAAAGIIGLIKAVLCLKNKKLVPSLNYKKTNEFIDMANSPFYVNSKLADWPENKDKKRRAAVSSFGFSGTNVHVILEEAPVISRARIENSLPAYPVPFSAMTKKSLSKGIKDFEKTLNNRKEYSLGDISFTLSTGRNHFPWRLFISAESKDELAIQLKKIIKHPDQYMVLQKTLKNESYSEQMQSALKSISDKGGNSEDALTHLGQAYLGGGDIDFSPIFQGGVYNRVSLSTYSFDTKEYWIKDDKTDTELSRAVLHPLVGENISTIHEFRFKTFFNQNDFFIKDHVIDSQKMLPGACFLEMALAAGELATEKNVVSLEKNIFLKPLVLKDNNTPVEILIGPEGDNIRYLICSRPGKEQICHGEGKIIFQEQGELEKEEEPSISKLKQEFTKHKGKDDFYKLFSDGGINYGTAFKAVDEVWYGEKGVVSKIILPQEQKKSVNEFSLHPSILDSVFQSVKVLLAEDEIAQNCIYLPFSIGKIKIRRRNISACYASVESVDREISNSSIRQFNIKVFDENDVVLLLIKDFVLHKVKGKTSNPQLIYICDNKSNYQKMKTPVETENKRYMVLDGEDRLWKGLCKEANEEYKPILVRPAKSYCKNNDFEYEVNIKQEEDFQKLFQDLTAIGRMPDVIVCNLAGFDFKMTIAGAKKVLQNSFYSTFSLSKALLSIKSKKNANLLHLYRYKADQEINPGAAAFSAFAKTLRRENPKFNYKNIGIKTDNPAEKDISRLVKIIKFETSQLNNNEKDVYYRNDTFAFNSSMPVKVVRDKKETRIKQNGVYLITGGTGGLGLIFARYILGKYNANVILCGRSRVDEVKKKKLAELKDIGGTVSYISCDIGNISEIKKAISKIQRKYGKLNGIIHSAGVARDSFLYKKTLTEVEEVFKSKVFGVINLDIATLEFDLDFVSYFSSISSVLGNIGQSDYSYANAFMDYYAEFREQLRINKLRSGKTISIKWPLWEEGGFQIDKNITSLDKELGLIPLSNSIGIEAFEDVLSISNSSVLVLYGQKDKVLENFENLNNFTEKKTEEKYSSDSKNKEDSKIAEKTSDFLKTILAAESKVSPDSIDEDTALEKYGIDSLMILNLTKELEKYFGEISKTLFFEYQTIGQLSTYFLDEHKTALMKHFEDADDKTEEIDIEKQAPSIEMTSFWKNKWGVNKSSEDNDIAIIGLAGHYPESKDLDEFWDKLTNGIDFIKEIPSERWDYRNIHSPSMNIIGKTYSKWGSFIDDIDKFDPLFFNISPKEAVLMDPNERLFLQTAAHTFEDAGYSRNRLAEVKTGVFVGVMWGQYQLYGSNRKEDVPGSSYASVANRVSYCYNLNGPSMTVDTMCSSSLTAIHLACESIARGDCNIALAGGVNLASHFNKYLLIAQGNFASSDGRCRSFGEGGDGYVPGEGVGAVLLKPLSLALKDNDNIYGVIKGISINHGGKTNGYTVPNPNAQRALIKEAYEKADIDPRTLTYIEAHGTGTALGDPIEITGLQKAFEEYTGDKQFCSIGSIKSNIGHLEAASGIAGVTKILLQFKHKKLVPSIHSDITNPSIKFQNTPFYVQRTLEQWQRPEIEDNGVVKSYPRRAGISSFGAGGSNVHIVFEEFVQKDLVSQNKPELIIVSAKDKDGLKEYLTNLRSFLKKKTQLPLSHIAYTLQTGRDFFDHRFGCITSSMEELDEKLTAFLNDKINDQKYFYNVVESRIKSNKKVIEKHLDERNLEQLGRLWVEGNNINWEHLYLTEKVRKISLPVYPFAKESYWIDEDVNKSIESSKDKTTGEIHPLIHRNDSDLYELKFTTLLSGDEFFFRDHLVNDRALLPGVACLEMAAVAASISTKSAVYKFNDVLWLKPIMGEKEKQSISVSLEPESDHFAFEVFKIQGSGERVVYTKGKVFAEALCQSSTAQNTINIEDIVARCNIIISHEDCYQLFNSKNLKYGKTMKVVQEIRYNNHEVISSLKASDESLKDYNEYFLNPAVMDGALQASFGFLMNDANRDFLFMPIAIEEIVVFDSPEAECYSYVQKNEEEDHELDDIKKYNIQIVNPDGKVAVVINNFIIKKVVKQIANEYVGHLDEELSSRYYSEVWKALELDSDITRPSKEFIVFSENESSLYSYNKAPISNNITAVYKSDTFEKFCHNFGVNFKDKISLNKLFDAIIQKGTSLDKIVYILPEGIMDEKVFFDEFENILTINKALIELHLQSAIEFLLVSYHSNEIHPLYSGMSGYGKSLRLENPKVIFRNLFCINNKECLFEYIATELGYSDNKYIDVKYDNGKRLYKTLMQLSYDFNSASVPLKDNGVYLITGGTGGLGFIFAKYLASCASGKINLILTGRSNLDAEKNSKIEELIKMNAEVLYIQSDVSVLGSVQEILFRVIKTYGKVDGIIHSAGITRDSFVLKKTMSDVKDVLLPKITGTMNLDLCTKDQKLDFFILFSSLAGVIGNLGQCDYAYANSFQNYYAEYRNKLCKAGECSGKTISIAWPLWADGGMSVDSNTRQLITEKLGLTPLRRQTGEMALANCLNVKQDSIVPLEGPSHRIGSFVSLTVERFTVETEGQSEALVQPEHNEVLEKYISNYLKQIVAEEIKLPITRLLLNEPLEKYGIDSVTILNLTDQLEKDFGKLSKTLFFEYKTLADLAGYFLENHQKDLIKKSGVAVTVEKPAPVPAPTPKKSAGFDSLSKVKSRFFSNKNQVMNRDDVAIIGLAGKYPHSKSLEVFWEHLKEGHDFIEEIPENRWDHSAVFEENKNTSGKAYTKWGSFLDDIEMFDPLFFNIAPREAALLDPQERILLETVHHSLEDAGYSRKNLANKSVGVYIGVMWSHYQLYASNVGENKPLPSSSFASIANRVSYFYDFKGPSLALDTMCSSSLYAIYLACESLHNNDSDMAIAGAVNLTLHKAKHILLSQGNFAATDGRCRAFGEGGTGYVPGEGCGIVVLKSLKKAVEDKDHIYGVIKGGAINHGGRTNGYTVPNPQAQADVISKAINRAGIKPRSISYIETHGTGTALGDPIEVTGLQKAFKTKEKQFCSIGSIKSNIGHLEAAAGIAGLTKILLQMKYKILVPSIHSKMLNPNIDFKNTPFFVQQNIEKWNRPLVQEKGNVIEYPRRACLSAFGAGGSNGHLIIEEYRSESPSIRPQTESVVVPLSARNKASLLEMVQNLKAVIDALPGFQDNHEKDISEKELNVQDSILTDVTKLLAEVLNISPDEIDVSDSFDEYGVTMQEMNTLCSQINIHYDSFIAFSDLKDCLTLDELVEVIKDLPGVTKKYTSHKKQKTSILPKNLNIFSLAYTLQVGREDFDERVAFICSTIEELREQLSDYINDRACSNCFGGNAKASSSALNILIDDIGDKKIVDMLLEKNDLTKVAKYWVLGLDLDWTRFYKNNNFPPKVSLPQYPFDKVRCWIFKDSFDNDWNSSGITSASNKIVSTLFKKTWKTTLFTKDYDIHPDSCYIILAGSKSLPLARKISDSGKIKALIIEDNQTESQYSFDYNSVDSGYKAAQLLNGKESISGIIDLDDLMTVSDYGVIKYGKIAFYQRFLKSNNAKRLQMIHLSDKLEECNSPVKNISASVTSGFVKMLGAEYRRVFTKRIDVDLDSLSSEDIKSIILDELSNLGDPEVGYRNGERYRPILQEEKTINKANKMQLAPDKVYVITGGTRGLGAEMAKSLVQRGVKKLVLMGISPLPQKDKWEEELVNPRTGKGLKNKLKFLLSLVKAGISVELYIGGLTEKDKLPLFFNRIRKKLGSIGGVIHCAGLVNNNNPPFINKTIEDIRSVLEPKVEGLNTLHEVFKKDQLDFFILFSSIASLIPAIASGVSDYAVGNGYMDYFVNQQNAQGNAYYKSIQWPNWIEAGMGEVKNPYYEYFGLSKLTNQQGIDLFYKAIESEHNIIMPALINPQVFKSTGKSILDPKVERNNVKKQKVKKVVVSKASSDIKQKLIELFSTELMIPAGELGPDTSFGEFGVDSVIIAEMVTKIEDIVNATVEPSALLEYPTINSLSSYLGSEYSVKEQAVNVEVEAETEILNEEAITHNIETYQPESSDRGSQEFSVNHISVHNHKTAVIGVSCNFPGAKNKTEFWNNLVNGVSSIQEVPRSRWDIDQYYSKEYQDGKSISKWGGFINDIEYFDPDYFKLKHDIASHLDPLVRQFMEVGVDCLRDGGYENEELSGKPVGVFVGSRVANYSENITTPLPDSIVGIGQNFIAAHLAHFLNLTGPNMVVDTACSSSLMSINLACQSLAANESEMAIAGGVDILLDEKPYLLFSKSGTISPDGRCFTFDRKANGFVPGEGCGAVLLKSLDKAIEDGDRIYAVIESVAVNNDGRTMGITTPNPKAQSAVIEKALEKGSISASSVSCIETHGTGTKIGDPIELKALTSVFNKSTDNTGFCAVGSVKTNIGHLLSAAGVASVIKMALSLEHKTLPPTLNCSDPNPRFDFKASPFYPNLGKRNWDPIGSIRYCGISGFGFGGTNVHMILGDSHRPLVKEVRRHPLGQLNLNKRYFWHQKNENAADIKTVSKAPVSRMATMLALKSIN